MLNFMGLGFNFGGKDAGLSKAIDGALNSVSKLTSGIAGVSSAMGQLAEQGRDPTTDFEAEMTHNNVSLTRMGANLGKTGKELSDYTQKSQGLALSMNRSAEEAGNATGQFDRMRDVMVKGGIDSEKTMLKIADASGVNAKVFSDASLRMSKMTGMSKEAGAAILDTMTAAGTSMKDVPGALQQIEHRMKLLDKRNAMLAAGFKGIGIEQFSKEIDDTSKRFMEITKSSAGAARTFSTSLAESIQGAAADFQNLTVGAGEMPDLLKSAAMSTGDVETAFKSMEGGTEGFMKMMRNMTKNLGGDKKKIGEMLKFVGGHMKATFGPETTTDMINMLAASSAATDAHVKGVEKATGALKGYGDTAFKNGRTAAETMALSEKMFEAGIRNANRTADEFAASAAKSFGSLGKDIEDLAKGEGGVGDLTRGLIDLNQKGLVGLFPKELQGDAVAMGGMMKMLGKTLEGIVNPLSFVESGITLFAVAMRHAYKETNKNEDTMTRLRKSFQTVGNQFMNWFENLPDRITGFLNDIEKSLGDFLGGKGGGGAGKWGPMLKRFWERFLNVFTKIGPIVARLKKFATEFWAGFTTTMSTDPAKDSLGTKAGKWLGEIWESAKTWFDANVWKPIQKFGKDFWEGLTTALDPEKSKAATASYEPTTGGLVGKWLGEVIVSAQKYWDAVIVPAAEKFWDDFSNAFDDKGDPATVGGKIGIGLIKAFDAAFDKLLDKVPGLMWKLIKSMASFNPADPFGALSGLGKHIGRSLMAPSTGGVEGGGEAAPPNATRGAGTGAGTGAGLTTLANATDVAAAEQKQRDLEMKDIALRNNYLLEQQLNAVGVGFSSMATSSASGGSSNVGYLTPGRPSTQTSSSKKKPGK